MVNMEKVYEITSNHFRAAKEKVDVIKHRDIYEASAAISDTIPGYSADILEFGDYATDNFAVLFIDMRESTKRAAELGVINTFLTMHAYIPAMLECVKFYKGNVIDIMGDGIMVFFGGRQSSLTKVIAIQNAGLCGRDMMYAKRDVTNRILSENSIPWPIRCGVGVDYGDVFITKIGVSNIFDVKAYGDCINYASKHSGGYDEVMVSKAIKNNWPTGDSGTIVFTSKGDGYVLSQSKG